MSMDLKLRRNLVGTFQDEWEKTVIDKRMLETKIVGAL